MENSLEILGQKSNLGPVFKEKFDSEKNLILIMLIVHRYV